MTTTFEYTVTRTINAPVEKVWQAWTEPKHYATWFNAVPETVSLDVRTGGSWASTLITPDGQEFPLSGRFTKVVKNKRIVMTMDVPGQAPETMEFAITSEGTQTAVTLHQKLKSQESCDTSREGSEYLLDSFAAYVPTI